MRSLVNDRDSFANKVSAILFAWWVSSLLLGIEVDTLRFHL